MAKQDNSAFNTAEGLHKHTHMFTRKKNQCRHFNLKYVLTKTRQFLYRLMGEKVVICLFLYFVAFGDVLSICQRDSGSLCELSCFFHGFSEQT